MKTSLLTRTRLWIVLVFVVIASGVVAIGFPEVIPGRAPSTLVVTVRLENSPGTTTPLAGIPVWVETMPVMVPGVTKKDAHVQMTDATGVARFTLGNYWYVVLLPCAPPDITIDPCAFGTTTLQDGRTVALVRPINMRAGTTVNVGLDLSRRVGWNWRGV